MKTVYVAMSADRVHPGHLNSIRTAAELGEVAVGVRSTIDKFKIGAEPKIDR